jgi:hypothetical protein
MALPYPEDHEILIKAWYAPDFSEHLDPANINSAWMLTGGSWARALESMGTIRMAEITLEISGQALLDRITGSSANVQGTIQRPVTMTFDDGHTFVFPAGTPGTVRFVRGQPESIRLDTNSALAEPDMAVPAAAAPVGNAIVPSAVPSAAPPGPPATGGRRRRFTNSNRLRHSRRKSASRRRRGKPTRR